MSITDQSFVIERIKKWTIDLNSVEAKFIFIALLFGAGIGVARAQSYSLFLNNLDAIWTLPALLLSELFYLPIIRARRTNERVARSIASTGLIFSFVFLLNVFNPNSILSALIFFSITVLIRNLVRWMIAEISLIHLGATKSSEISYFVSAALDFGSILAVLSTLIFNLNPKVHFGVIALSWLSLFVMTRIIFSRPETFEIKLASEEFPGSSLEPQFKSKVTKSYILLNLSIGLFYALQEYLWRSNLQELIDSKTALLSYTNFYVIGSNLLGVASGWYAATATQNTRLSPEKVIRYFLLSGSIGLFILSLFPTAIGAVALGIFCSGTFRSFYASANNNLLSTFDDQTRSQLRKLSQFMVSIIPLVPVFLVSFLMHQLLPDFKLEVLTATLSLLILGSLVTLKNFTNDLTNLMYVFLQSQDRIRKVNGALLLSFLRPKGYDLLFKEILTLNPKTLLIKTIIESLSFHPTRRSIKIITSQFENPKEEIKFAVCDALYRIDRPEATSFLMGIAFDTKQEFRVRQKSIKLLKKKMGKHLIPVLLSRLDGPNPDEIKVVIEALSEIKYSEISNTFLNYIEDSPPEILKFALIGLYKSSQNRLVFTDKINDLLLDPESANFGLACFVLGEVRDPRWLERVQSVRIRNRSNMIYQTWYIYRLTASLRIDLIAAIKRLLKDPEFKSELIKLFVNFNPRDRIKILYTLHVNQSSLDLNIDLLLTWLKEYHFDFHEEILFLHNLKRRSKDKPQRKSA